MSLSVALVQVELTRLISVGVRQPDRMTLKDQKIASELAPTQRGLIARQAIALGESPGADDFKPVDVGQVTGERRKGRGQTHDTLCGLIQQRLG